MTTAWGKIGRTIGSLALALCNATLILVALCLWLAWQVSDTARSVANDISGRVASLDPLRTELAGLTAEVGGLRQELAAIRAGNGVVAASVQDRIAALDTRLQDAATALDKLTADPAVLVQKVVEGAGRSLSDGAAQLMQCAAAGDQP